MIELVRVGTDEIPITQKRCSAMKNLIGLIAASCLLPTVSHAAETPIGTLGSGLIDHIQKMTIAAITMADMKVWAQRS